jgi:pimeloyl-ACP methyl ester carboxylesterase
MEDYSMQRFLLMLALSVVASVAQATTGVALVHGTGNQTDAATNYWQADMVAGVRSGLSDSNNLLVVNCDFTQYMWDNRAAGCLAQQLTDFINARNIDKLIIITHSNGGNVMRWILSNPTYDARYPNIISRIVRVDAIAPSSAGTPLADAVINGNVFESALGWLLGYQNDAVRQQQTGSMATYNQQNLLGTAGRPSLPTPFRDAYGSDVAAAVWNSDAYCGGYAQSVGLAITQNWLDSCSDGFINCTSAQAAGSVWFKDTQVTDHGAVLNHNQSRRACFGLQTILSNDIKKG